MNLQTLKMIQSLANDISNMYSIIAAQQEALKHIVERIEVVGKARMDYTASKLAMAESAIRNNVSMLDTIIEALALQIRGKEML